MRSDRYKLIFFYGQDYKGRSKNATPVAWEFYDLEKDPYEMTNQYKNSDYSEIITRLKKKLKDVRLELGETDESYPHLNKIVDDNWFK